MEPYEYEAMFELEDNLWWYRAMRHITASLLEQHLPRRSGLTILDAGAGSGGSLPLLEPMGQVTAFDYSKLAVDFYKTRRAGRVAQASAAAMPYAGGTFDLVTVFDVLATLPDGDEQAALAEMSRVLKPGGHLFWREPALQFLYGPHDRATHVYRRYTTAGFRERLQRIGLEPVVVSYANSLLFPVAAVRRLAARVFGDNETPRSDVRPMREPLNGVLAGVLSFEAVLLKRLALPVGLSVITLAKKQ